MITALFLYLCPWSNCTELFGRMWGTNTVLGSWSSCEDWLVYIFKVGPKMVYFIKLASTQMPVSWSSTGIVLLVKTWGKHKTETMTLAVQLPQKVSFVVLLEIINDLTLISGIRSHWSSYYLGWCCDFLLLQYCSVSRPGITETRCCHWQHKLSSPHFSAPDMWRFFDTDNHMTVLWQRLLAR